MRLIPWAARRSRARPAQRPTRLWSHQRVRVALPLALVFVYLTQPTPLTLSVGAAVASLGLLVRALAAGQLYKHEALVTSGVYGATRNPLYFGSAVMGAGFAVAAHSWMAGSLLVGYFAAFYPAAMRREEQRLRVRYGRPFEEYAARVPAFWPRPTTLGCASAGFSWAVYRHNAEYQAATGVVLGIAALWVKALMRQGT